MKKILFSVLGLSPQILTETLFALMKDDNLPDEVHVLTTQRGADMCKRALFQENGGWFYRFCQDWRVSGIKFNEDHIHTIRDIEGNMIADIRSDEDNQSISNQIVDFVRQFTQTPDSRLHVSIAGGRKTMGFYAGYALSMFGRDGDQLSHVLVSEEFEGHPEFFYPTPNSRVIRTRNQNELLDCIEAKVELAYLPFLAMRNVIPDSFIAEELQYEDMVKRLQKRVFDKKVLICAEDKTLSIADEIIRLTPINFAFYYWLTQRIQNGEPGLNRPFKDDPNLDYGDEFIECLKTISHEMDDHDATINAMQAGMSYEFISERMHAIKKKLVKQLGTANADDFIPKVLDKPTRLIGIQLKAHQIHFI